MINLVNRVYACHDVELLVVNPASCRVHSDSDGMIRLKKKKRHGAHPLLLLGHLTGRLGLSWLHSRLRLARTRKM